METFTNRGSFKDNIGLGLEILEQYSDHGQVNCKGIDIATGTKAKPMD